MTISKMVIDVALLGAIRMKKVIKYYVFLLHSNILRRTIRCHKKGRRQAIY